jgi:hypothetical protein
MTYMADHASRRGAADLGMPLMILAFAVLGGFLYWLSGQVATERALTAAADSAAAAEAAPEYTGTAQTITGEQIQMDAAPFLGEEVRLVDMPVASRLGTQGFWIEMPNGNPFLVSMDSTLQASGLEVQQGDTTTVIGRVMAIGDSVLTAWTDAGTIGEGDRLAAEFATHFLAASEVEVQPGGGGAPQGGEPGDTGNGGL